MDLFIFDMQFNRIGIIDTYVDAEFVSKYHDHSQLILTVDASKTNADLLLTEDLRIITKSTDIHRGYVINVAEYRDEEQLEIIIIAKSLSVMTSWRIIEGQQRYTGNVEDVLKNFVKANAIQPFNASRIIPDLVLGLNEGININVDEAFSNKDLDVALWEMCAKYDISYEILMNHDAKKYVFSTFMGIDRSTEQSINSNVIFAKAFDNVIMQSYVDDKSNYRSTAYVAGEGEADNRTVIKVNDGISGFNRREIFIDARDLQSTYKDDNDEEITLTPVEYQTLLNERGQNRLSEYQRIRTFESDIDLYSQFIFNEHYFLGDKVTNRNDELGVVTHSRVMTAKEIFDREGYHLSLEFGTSIPTLLDKIKRGAK